MNLILSIDPTIGIYRNLGFLRIIIFFIAINYFLIEKKFMKKLLFFWLITLLVVVVDVFIEGFYGKNIFGYGGKYGGSGGSRIVSFFKDEPIVGGYILGFYFLLFGFLLDKYKNKNQYLAFTFGLIFLAAILITGERSNAIKAILGTVLLILFYKN